MANNRMELSAVKAKVAAMVTPTAEERAIVEQVAREVCARVEAAAERAGLRARAEVEGSVAKDTWIATDRDLDIFIIFPEGTPPSLVKEVGLQIAKEAAGEGWKLGYAEHPYVEASIRGFTVDIVPSIEMKGGERPAMSVDRTPLHTKYVSSRVDSRLKAEIRILKQFMKGIGVYGAELKVGGFSGYLCELLVLKYGSFEGVLEAASAWKGTEAVDISGNGAPFGDLPASPLHFPDPVDTRRNAAAAVTEKAYASFIAASRAFLKDPAEKYFFPPRPSVSSADLVRMVGEKGSLFMGIAFGCPNIPSDILWGELNKSLSRICKAIEGEGFYVLDAGAWSDEAERAIFILELDRAELPNYRVHMGPMVHLATESERFLSKYLSSEEALAGPYIRGGRWCVDLRRKLTSIDQVFCEILPRAGLSKHIADSLSKGFELYFGESLCEAAGGEGDLFAYVYDFVRKRPKWLS